MSLESPKHSEWFRFFENMSAVFRSSNPKQMPEAYEIRAALEEIGGRTAARALKGKTDQLQNELGATRFPPMLTFRWMELNWGVTPSDIHLTCCWHDLTIMKPGRKPWTRRIRLKGRDSKSLLVFKNEGAIPASTSTEQQL